MPLPPHHPSMAASTQHTMAAFSVPDLGGSLAQAHGVIWIPEQEVVSLSQVLAAVTHMPEMTEREGE